MKKRNNKIFLYKMKTEYGSFPILSNSQRVNRPITVYYAERTVNDCNESVFFIIRPKDAETLRINGFSIKSIDVPKLHYPIALKYISGTILETRKH